jgi:putative membrane protein
MSIKIFTTAAAAALALAGCAPMAGDTMGGQGAMGAGAMTADMTPEGAMGYVAMAGASDMFEIRSSQLQQQRGAGRAGAQLRGDDDRPSHAHHGGDHGGGAGGGMNPPAPMLLPMQQQMIARLEALNGAAFDREYVRQQVTAHEMALALHENYARAGDTPALRATAAAAVPVVRGHLGQARGMRM